MRDILSKITAWAAQGEAIALATVLRTWGSSPREVGAHMAVTGRGEIAGSVSGGCVEGAVIEAAAQVLESGQPQRLHFGVADQMAWSLGLSCGGEIDVFVRPLSVAQVERWAALLQAGQSFISVMVVEGPAKWLGKEFFFNEAGRPLEALPDDLASLVVGPESQPTGLVHSDPQTGLAFFINGQTPPLTLIVVGGVHIAIPLVALAKTMQFRVVLIDPRRVFGSPQRFPSVERLLTSWPDKALRQVGIHANTALAVLTHDPKIDDPALLIALRSPAFYVGALGSRKTHAKRRQRLLEAGLTEVELDRLHAPIGLNLGGRSPEEIALAIMAEIVQARST